MFIQCLVDFKLLCEKDPNHYQIKDKEVICPEFCTEKNTYVLNLVKLLNDTNFLNYLGIVNLFLIPTQLYCNAFKPRPYFLVLQGQGLTGYNVSMIV